MKWFDLSHQWLSIKEEIFDSISTVFNHQQFVNGPEVTEFEKKMSSYLNVKAVACHSGTDALVLALKVMGTQKGDGVLTSCYSFIATAEAICRVGAVPLFCDIDSKTFNLDVNTLDIGYKYYQQKQNCISFNGRISGILAINLFGIPCDYDQINHWAKKKNLFVIEDAAQSIGASLRGKPSGSLADISTTSFYPTKSLGAYGQGGAVFCKTTKQEEKIRSLTQHGIESRGYTSLGLNSRMDTIQAAILLVKWKEFSANQKHRKKIAEQYQQKLSPKLLSVCPNFVESSFSVFSILIENKSLLEQKLRKQKIPFQNYYSPLLSDQPIFLQLGYKKNQFPVANRISNQIINLPLYPSLSKNDQQLIIDILTNKF